MKSSLMCVAFLLLAGSACAQQSRSGTPTSTSQGYWNNGGYGGGGYGGYGSLSSGAGRPVHWEPPKEFSLLYARNDGEFVPSTFMNYDEAVALGNQILAQQASDQSENPNVSVAAAARAYRVLKVPTMKLQARVTQDGAGKLVVCNLNGNDCHRP